MAFFNASSDSSRASLKLVAETVVGTTPATPAGKELEITGEGLSAARDTVTSASFRSDRQVPGATTTGETSSGDINIELKYGGVIDDLIAAGLQGVWADDVVSNGVARQSFTIEKEFTDATGDKVQIYRGSEITSMGMELATGALVTMSFGVMARNFTAGASSIMTTTVPAPTTQFMSSVADGFALEVDGVSYAQGIQSLSWTLDNNAREQRQIGTKALAGIGMGRSNLTGTLTAYFNGTNPLYTAYKNDTNVELSYTVPDVDGNAYKVTFHSLKLTNATIVAGGLDQDVVMEIPFQAVLGGDDSLTVSIERIPAI